MRHANSDVAPSSSRSRCELRVRRTALTLSCAAKAHVPKPQRRDGCRQNCSTHQAAWQPACPPRASKMREAARPPGRSQAATASASSSAAVIVLDHRSAGRTAPARFRNWCGAGERHRRNALGAKSVELRGACGGGDRRQSAQHAPSPKRLVDARLIGSTQRRFSDGSAAHRWHWRARSRDSSFPALAVNSASAERHTR
jgi:hypothetical protein